MPKRRVFFALCPPSGLLQSIREQVYALGKCGRLVAVEKLHVTLLFLGSLEAKQLECVCAAADSIQCTRFALSLEQVLFKKRQTMLWLMPSYVPPGLLQLAQALRDGLTGCDLNLEKHNFKPHLTLARNIRARPHIPGINLPLWAVEAFFLLESVPQTGGNHYQQVQKWFLS